MSEKKWFEWTVKFKVHRVWVEDGFELTDETAIEMLGERLGYANMTTELKAKVIESPEQNEIRKAQGYND